LKKLSALGSKLFGTGASAPAKRLQAVVSF